MSRARYEHDQFKAVLDDLSDGVYFVDADRNIIYWNRGAERITGFLASDVLGRSSDGILMHVDVHGNYDGASVSLMALTIADGQAREAQLYLRHAEGHRVPIRLRVSPLRDASGKIVGAADVFSDQSTIAAAERRIDQLQAEAVTDPLTGILNRRGLEREIGAAIASYETTGRPWAVLMADLDEFKGINDAYGHPVGDKALIVVARTLQYNLRRVDFVGRWGGDEFLVGIHTSLPGYVKEVAEKLRVLVESSAVQTPAGYASLTVSMGAAVVRPGDDPAAIMERADRHLYEAKSAGRNRVVANSL